MNDEDFKRILAWFGLNWEGYRRVRKGVKKRLVRHMQQLQCRKASDYLAMIERNPDVEKACSQCLTVSISRFFRDWAVWERLQEYVATTVGAKNLEVFYVWSAGCACGEEAYSFKILWTHLENRLKRLPRLELWATDVNPEVLDKARLGVYSGSSLKNVPDEWRTEFFHFERKSRTFQINSLLKTDITWGLHDLLVDDPPGKVFHVIFLRNNLLTYTIEDRQKAAFANIFSVLLPGGWLILGDRERVPDGYGGSFIAAGHPKIFQKLPADLAASTGEPR